MNGAELLVRTLETNGVEYIFGVPGDIENTLFKAMSQSKIKFFNVRQEQAGAIMADVYYRLTGKIGVCFSTLGPGAANMLTGVANATQDRSAILAISGQLAQKKHFEDSHQFINLVELYRGVSKASYMVDRSVDIAAKVQTSIDEALSGKPGPVHLTFPVDVLDEVVTSFLTVNTSSMVSFHYQDEAETLADLIRKSKKVLVIVGSGVARASATRLLLKFLSLYHLPAYCSFQGKGTVPTDFPLNCGVLSRHSKKASQILSTQDLIITIGFDVIEGVEPEIWNGAKKVVHIDSSLPSGTSINRPDLEVVGDVKKILKLLIRQYKPVKKRKIDIEAMKLKVEPPDGIKKMFPLHPAQVTNEIGKVLKHNDIVVSDVGLHKQFLGLYYNASHPHSVIFSNGLSAMGFALPAAIAAKLVKPQKKVVAVVGDGGFQMNIQELATAMENKLAIVCVIFNDGAYGMVKDKQLQTTGTVCAADFKMKLNFKAIAEAYGGKGYEVNNINDLKKVLKEAVREDCLSIIDVPIQQYCDIEVMK